MEVNQRELNLIYLITFVDLFAVGIIFPVLGPYVRSLGCSHIAVGVLTSIYSALQVVSGPIIGSWSDVRGRKSVFTITLLLSTIFYFAMGFSQGVKSLFTFRFLLGIFKQTQMLNKAIVADLVGDDKDINTQIYGRSTSFGSMGFVIGPIVGGYLSEYPNGFQYICTLTSVLFLVNIVLVQFLPNLPADVDETCGSAWENFRDEMRKTIDELKEVEWMHHWPAFVLKFLYILSTTMFFSNQSIYMKEKYDFGKVEIGYIISFVSIVGVITGFCLGFLTKRLYPRDIHATKRSFHTFAMLTISFIGFYCSWNVYSLGFFLVPFGFCNAVLRIVTMELLFDDSEPGERGSLTGASDSMMAMGRFMAPLTAGFISDYFNENCIMLYACGVAFIGTLISYYVHKKVSKEKRD